MKLTKRISTQRMGALFAVYFWQHPHRLWTLCLGHVHAPLGYSRSPFLRVFNAGIAVVSLADVTRY